MNPLTNMKNVLKLSEQDLKNQTKTSWHDMYRDSAWIFVGGLPYDLTEGDAICVFSQYGEIVNLNLVRDKKTGKSKGFCFICYEDQRSTILAVDNLNGIKILNRTLRVDHVHEYKVPKDDDHIDDETKRLRLEGCAPKLQIPAENIKKEFRPSNSSNSFGVSSRLPIGKIKTESNEVKIKKEKREKHKKDKKDKKLKKKRRRSSSSSSNKSEEKYVKEKKSKKTYKEKQRRYERRSS